MGMGLGELDRKMIPEGELAVAEKNEGSPWPEHEIVDAWVKKHWRGLDWGSGMIAELKKVVSAPRIATEKLAEKYREELGKMETRALCAEAALEPAVEVLQKRIDSIASMLGWSRASSQKALEGTISAMKERLRLAEDELRETRQTLSSERKGWKVRLQKWAKQLGLPDIEPNGRYTSGGVTRQISRWQNVMEFYGLVGNWQGMKCGHTESACDRDIGGRARAAMGKPDREVPEEDDDEVLDNGHDRAVCGCVECGKFRDEKRIPEKPQGLAHYIPNDGRLRETAGWDELYLHAEAADIYLEESLRALTDVTIGSWGGLRRTIGILGHVLGQNSFDTGHDHTTCECGACTQIRKGKGDEDHDG